MRIFLFTTIFICFINCGNEDNDELFKQFESEFVKSIEVNKGKTFDYFYDGLVSQNSFLINSKLKYLKYKHNPENGTVESLVYFDLQTDSIYKIMRRKILFEWDEVKKQKTKNFTDTIYMIQFDKKKTFTYVNNQIVDSSFNISVFDLDKDFIKRIKIATEKNYVSN